MLCPAEGHGKDRAGTMDTLFEASMLCPAAEHRNCRAGMMGTPESWQIMGRGSADDVAGL